MIDCSRPAWRRILGSGVFAPDDREGSSMRRFHSSARSRGRSLLAIGVAGALCAGLVGLATGWAAADEAKPIAEADGAVFGAVPPGFASWAEAIAVQGRLEAAAARVTKAGGAATGLAGVE